MLCCLVVILAAVITKASCEEDEPPRERWLMSMRMKQDVYLKFAMVFMKAMKPREEWRKQRAIKPFSIMFTASDEAFAVWMCLNHCERWFDMHAKNNWKESEVQAKWTNSGKSKKDGRSKKFMGVSQAGIQKFNSLLLEVRKQRKNRELEDFDAVFKEAVKREMEKEDSKSGKEAAKENETWAETDFDWDDEGDAGLDEESNCDSGIQGMTGV